MLICRAPGDDEDPLDGEGDGLPKPCPISGSLPGTGLAR